MKMDLNFQTKTKCMHFCNLRGIQPETELYMGNTQIEVDQGLRLVLGAFRTSPVSSLYAEANEPPLYIRRQKLSLQYLLKLMSYAKGQPEMSPISSRNRPQNFPAI